MAKYSMALDQGTTSSRAMIFNHEGRVESVSQKEHEQIYPKPGWVEHDPKEIWARCREVLDEALESAGTGCGGPAARPAPRRGSPCRWRPTSPAPRSAGSSTTSTAPATAPRPA